MRGWGPESFKRAKPEFMDAVRWGLFLEKAVPFLAHWKQVQAMTADPKDTDVLKVIAQKKIADQIIPELTALIYPEDADGG